MHVVIIKINKYFDLEMGPKCLLSNMLVIWIIRGVSSNVISCRRQHLGHYALPTFYHDIMAYDIKLYLVFSVDSSYNNLAKHNIT